MSEPKATEKQRRYIWVLCQITHSQVPHNLESMTKADAGREIGSLKLKKANQARQRLKRRVKKVEQHEQTRRANRGSSMSSTHGAANRLSTRLQLSGI
jgi:hypothetical protein